MLPAVVAPEPKRWLTANDGFEPSHIFLGECVVWIVRNAVGHLAHLAAIVAASDTPYIGEENRGIHFFTNTFRTAEHWRVVMQEVGPYVDVLGARTLVGDEADDGVLALAFEL